MILLDTHAWIWWASQSSKLSAASRQRIEAESELGISPISCWEVAMLVEKGRLKLDRDVGQWVEEAMILPKAILAPLTPRIAVRAVRLPATFHGDPADRMIVATAQEMGVPVVTKDERIQEFGLVATIW